MRGEGTYPINLIRITKPGGKTSRGEPQAEVREELPRKAIRLRQGFGSERVLAESYVEISGMVTYIVRWDDELNGRPAIQGTPEVPAMVLQETRISPRLENGPGEDVFVSWRDSDLGEAVAEGRTYTLVLQSANFQTNNWTGIQETAVATVEGDAWVTAQTVFDINGANPVTGTGIPAMLTRQDTIRFNLGTRTDYTRAWLSRGVVATEPVPAVEPQSAIPRISSEWQLYDIREDQLYDIVSVALNPVKAGEKRYEIACKRAVKN